MLPLPSVRTSLHDVAVLAENKSRSTSLIAHGVRDRLSRLCGDPGDAAHCHRAPALLAMSSGARAQSWPAAGHRPGLRVDNARVAGAGHPYAADAHFQGRHRRRRLPPGPILAPGDPTPPKGAASLKLNVRQFIAQPNGAVILAADWTLLDAGGQPVTMRSTSLHEAGGPCTDAMVGSMSAVMGKLADQVAAAIDSRLLCGAGADTRN
ncbi:ABC-type transport auxiliary lipoprotein family protein [Lichenicoccus sp.]|uniref:ABC-type transport auxiliary lipoprotein family protein n=1 Tax=Lichenicoccus sp. TaxID=2781899 RepID=UPI003D12A5B2